MAKRIAGQTYRQISFFISHQTSHYYTQIKHLGHLGGATEKEVVHRILRSLMTDTLATQLNWKGTGKVGIEKMKGLTDTIFRKLF